MWLKQEKKLIIPLGKLVYGSKSTKGASFEKLGSLPKKLEMCDISKESQHRFGQNMLICRGKWSNLRRIPV